MRRAFTRLLVGAILPVGGLSIAGCSHMVESRVITAFAMALDKDDLPELKKVASEDFESDALSRDEALASMKQLSIPTSGKPKILKVINDEKGDTKRVTVQMGKTSGPKVYYRLKKDESGKWVVDDLYLSKTDQSKGKSVARDMKLLLSVRGILDAWGGTNAPAGGTTVPAGGTDAPAGEINREALLATTTPEFRKALEQLPPEEMLKLARKLTGEIVQGNSVRPQVELREDTADIRVARSSGGDLIIKLQRDGDDWRVGDMAQVGRRGQGDVSSVIHLASAMNTAMAFEAAYARQDKAALENTCTPRLFRGSLAGADLSTVPLPAPKQDAQPEIVVEGSTATFVTETPDEIVRIGLQRVGDADQPEAAVYRVDEVTLFELKTRQNKRLSVLYTGHAVLQLFSEAVAERDLDSLRLNSTIDFNKRVWSRLTPETLSALQLEIPAVAPQILNTVFQGQMTSITVMQGNTPLTYVLKDIQGKVLVDDILLPAVDRPESMKMTYDVLIPVQEFLASYESSDMTNLRGHSSREFQHLVWNQVEKVPSLEQDLPRHLRAPIGSIQHNPENALIILGDDNFGARVKLVREREFFRIDDVTIIAGPEESQRASLRAQLRVRLQNGL